MNSNQLDSSIAVLFSGGTDSTLAAALMAEKYQKVHLLTFDRFGFFGIENPKVNVEKLKNKFGQEKFIFKIINYDRLAKYVFYEKYIRNVIKHGFFLLSTCGLCKLAMHLKTIVYCLNNNIKNVCDGANKGMHLFPAQMKDVIAEIQKLYQDFGISYSNPVFNFEGPQDTGFTDRLKLERILPNDTILKEVAEARLEDDNKNTTGCQLCSMGLMPSNNVKGTKLDREMQPRCFQFILFNIFVKWYYLYCKSYEDYQLATLEFYKDKINNLSKVLEDFVSDRHQSKYKTIFESN